MTIEEKAKAYDEALEIAEKNYNAAQDLCNGSQIGVECFKRTLTNIFPELKQSEDERIRKRLCSFINDIGGNLLRPYLLTKDKVLSWLEKQDIFSKKDIDDAYLKGVEYAKNEIEKQYEASYQIRKDIATFIFNYKGDIKDRAKWMNYLGIKLSFVEKQGKSALEAAIEEKVDNQNCAADNIDSKFKSGDWIISLENGCVYQVIEVKCDIYIIRNIYNKEFNIGIEACERTGRLWTIQDVRDGEVLADKYNNIGIFKECEDTNWNSYIYLGCDGKLRGFSIGGSHEQTDTHPATQEQRDTLYKAMADAGYSFEFDKKELKKIESNSAWSEEDENRFKNLIMLVNLSKENEPTKKGFIDFINRLKSLRPQKQW